MGAIGGWRLILETPHTPAETTFHVFRMQTEPSSWMRTNPSFKDITEGLLVIQEPWADLHLGSLVGSHELLA